MINVISGNVGSSEKRQEKIFRKPFWNYEGIFV